jgi:hypothetical protein
VAGQKSLSEGLAGFLLSPRPDRAAAKKTLRFERFASRGLRVPQHNGEIPTHVATSSRLRDTVWQMNEPLGNGAMMKSGKQAAAVSVVRARDWRKGMSDHVAYGLLVYTALQIFFTIKALSEGSSSVLPYLALIVLVGGIIPVCRWFEKRWADLDDTQAKDPAYAPAFRRDAAMLWALAIGLPITLTLIFKAVLSVF